MINRPVDNHAEQIEVHKGIQAARLMLLSPCCSLGTSPMIRSFDMGYISTRMMESDDAFSDMGSLKQNLELPPEYAYDDGKVQV